MRKLVGLGALLCALAFSPHVHAAPYPTNAQDVGVCDPNAPSHCLAPKANGSIDVNASVSASVTGFRPTAYGTPLSVTTSSGAATLPAGAEVVATNTGATAAYCALGATATTSSQYIAPSGGWFGFAISGDTQLSCITASSTTTINTAGGSGLPTGTGGGGGSGGGGGAITAASGAYASGSIASGAVASGAVASGAYASGSVAAGAIVDLGTGSSPAANTVNANLKAINTTLGTPMQATGGTVSTTNLPSTADTSTGPAGANTIRVATATSSGAVVSFRQTATASAVVLPTNTLTNGLVCQSLSTNTGTIYLGPTGVTTGTGYALIAGQPISYGIANSNQLFMIGSNTTDVLNCTGN